MKISVITPSYNSADSIERAIQSVLKQNYDSFEHIVMDGGSTDGTVAILKRYPHVIWLSEKDSGQSDAMNKGIKNASGDLIMFMNADDEIYEGWFSAVVRIFKHTPSADIVVGNLEINRMGRQEYYRPSTKLSEILDYNRFAFPLNPISYIYKKSLQERAGDFPLNNNYTMDYWFLLRAYLFGKVVHCDFLSGVFYIDGKNKTSNREEAMKSLAYDRKDFQLKYWNHLGYIGAIAQKNISILKIFISKILHYKR